MIATKWQEMKMEFPVIHVPLDMDKLVRALSLDELRQMEHYVISILAQPTLTALAQKALNKEAERN
jgi:hypothetical protein